MPEDLMISRDISSNYTRSAIELSFRRIHIANGIQRRTFVTFPQLGFARYILR